MNWAPVATPWVDVTDAGEVEVAAAPDTGAMRLVIALSGIPGAGFDGNLAVYHKKGATLNRVAFGRVFDDGALPPFDVVTLADVDESVVALLLDGSGTVTLRAEILEATE